MEQNAIGKRIMELRKKHKMTRKALSNLTGIKERSIAAYERGENRPSAEFIEALSAHFGVNPTDILKGKISSVSKFSSFLRKYKYIKKLDNHELAVILNIDKETMEKWLNDYTPDIKELEVVSQALRVKPFDIHFISPSILRSAFFDAGKCKEYQEIYQSPTEIFVDDLKEITDQSVHEIKDENQLIKDVVALLKYAPEPFLENLKMKLLEFKNQSTDFFA